MSRAHARRAGLVLALALVPVAFSAQTPPDTAAPPEEVEVYRREVFQYQRAGRPDPFQPLTGSPELAIRPEDLQLSGVVYSPNPRESVAAFVLPGTERRIRLRTGERFGAMTLVAVYPTHVNVRVDEFGTSRTYSIQLQRQRMQGGAGLDADAVGAAGQQEAAEPTQPQQAEAQPPRTLQRRGSRAAQPATP